MNNVIHVKFPKQSQRKLPRQRVFYIGEYYAGPPLCQSLEKLWLKRKPNNRWVFQQKCQHGVYECEEYDGDDLIDAFEDIPMIDEVTIDDLLKMGWYHRGEVMKLEIDKLETNDEV